MQSSGTAGGFCRKFGELLKAEGEGKGNHTAAAITALASPSPVIISGVDKGLAEFFAI